MTGLYLGSSQVKKVYVGSTEAKAVYLGSTKIWSAGPSIGDSYMGGFYAGIIDTTKGNIESDDASQTGKRYQLIVAPKSLESGYTISGIYPDPAVPAAALTRWDGLAATNAMAAATGYTGGAAAYCAGLTYDDDGGSEWYLPSMDELELLYRSFKPTTDDNVVITTIPPSSPFPASTQGVGYNPSSDPAGVAYTTDAPARTSVADFLSTGTDYFEYLEYASTIYFSSTPATTITGSVGYFWSQKFGPDDPGDQFTEPGGNHHAGELIRPVRRLVLS